MSKVCLKWSLEDLCDMEERDMAMLLRSYGPNLIPSYEQVRLSDEDEDPNVLWKFDGAFGFAV